MCISAQYAAKSSKAERNHRSIAVANVLISAKGRGRERMSDLNDYDRGRYETLRLIASAYFGKDYYFDEPNGMIYSRESHTYMALDDAIAEFMGVIGE